MASYLVLTLISDDKQGLVESIAEVIAVHNGNWLESSMSQLAGKFAGILRVSLNDEDRDGLVSALQNLADDIKLVVESVSHDEVETEQNTLAVSLVGNDRPGIVKEISHTLATSQVNVEQLQSECQPAPISGDILFKANLKLKMPPGLSQAALQDELENLADDLMVEIISDLN